MKLTTSCTGIPLCLYKPLTTLLSYILLLFFITTTAQAQQPHPEKPKVAENGISRQAMLTVHAPDFAATDTLVIYVWPDLISGPNVYDLPYRLYQAKNRDGRYRFQLDSLPDITFFSLGKNSERVKGHLRPILNLRLVEPGDHISMLITNHESNRIPVQTFDSGQPIYETPYQIHFTGQEAAKYTLANDLDSLIAPHRIGRLQKEANRSGVKPIAERQTQLMQIYDSLENTAMGVLDRNKQILSDAAYQIMKAEIIGKIGYLRTSALNHAVIGQRMRTGLLRQGYLDSIHSLYRQHVMPMRGHNIPAKYRSRSRAYVQHTVNKLYGSRTLIANGGTLKGFYNFLKDVSDTIIKDRVLTEFIFMYCMPSMGSLDLEAVISDALTFMKNPNCRNLLQNMNARLPGSEIKNFVFYDQKDIPVDLQSFRGKVVFVDFYYNACLPCKLYFKNVVSPVYKSFEDNENVVFLMISTDNAADFKRQPELEEVERNRAGNIFYLYTRAGFDHPMIKTYNILSYPTPMLIDKNGKLASMGNPLRSIGGLSSQLDRLLANH